jgi:hypothetical protein
MIKHLLIAVLAFQACHIAKQETKIEKFFRNGNSRYYSKLTLFIKTVRYLVWINIYE